MIRRYEERDFDEIYKLICDLEKQEMDKEAFRNRMNYQLNSSIYHGFVYETDDEINGFMNIRIEAQLHHERKVAEIMELCVKKDFRNKGIGREMILFARKFAEDQDCERLELSTSTYRVDAQRFYINNGFGLSHFNLTCDLIKNKGDNK